MVATHGWGLECACRCVCTQVAHFCELVRPGGAAALEAAVAFGRTHLATHPNKASKGAGADGGGRGRMVCGPLGAASSWRSSRARVSVAPPKP